MLAVRLPETLEHELEELALKTGRTKSYYARLAIEEFLEDEADYRIALSRLENTKSAISLEDLEKKLDLES